MRGTVIYMKTTSKVLLSVMICVLFIYAVYAVLFHCASIDHDAIGIVFDVIAVLIIMLLCAISIRLTWIK